MLLNEKWQLRKPKNLLNKINNKPFLFSWGNGSFLIEKPALFKKNMIK